MREVLKSLFDNLTLHKIHSYMDKIRFWELKKKQKTCVCECVELENPYVGHMTGKHNFQRP